MPMPSLETFSSIHSNAMSIPIIRSQRLIHISTTPATTAPDYEKASPLATLSQRHVLHVS